jgi:hypothetical protein
MFLRGSLCTFSCQKQIPEEVLKTAKNSFENLIFKGRISLWFLNNFNYCADYNRFCSGYGLVQRLVLSKGTVFYAGCFKSSIGTSLYLNSIFKKEEVN